MRKESVCVDLKSAFVIAVTLLLCAWLGLMFANRVSGLYLRLMFGVFVVGLGRFGNF